MKTLHTLEVRLSLLGTVISYFENGKRSEVPVVNGKRHGTGIRYYEDGSKETVILFVNDKEHGKEIRYNEDGSKKSETVWENGKAVSGKEF